MADDDFASPMRLMNFVSQDQLEEARRTRGARVEDGTAQRDRSLFEILKENKDKRDAEFNERFKHRPPKALDQDETEFLDKLEKSKREYEQLVADEEAEELRNFQVAVEAQLTNVHEVKEIPTAHNDKDRKFFGRKNPPPRPLGMLIKAKPQAKKAKLDPAILEASVGVVKTPTIYANEQPSAVKNVSTRVSSSSTISSVDATVLPESEKTPNDDDNKPHFVADTGLVSYSDDSDEDD